MSESPAFKKTRIAPTPSGYLHLGNILSFVLTAGMAQKAGAKILLRIDDSDRERTNKRYVQDIFDTLNFLELPWHEGPRNMQEFDQQYSQEHRVTLYEQALALLVATGQVFACTCTRTDLLRKHPERIYTGTCCDRALPLDTKDVSWRLRTSPSKLLTMQTADGAVEAALPAATQYFMVKKRDGFAGYHVTSLVDDRYFGVDMIVRGADLWPSTLAQLYLASIMDYTTFADTIFYHHPLIMDADGHKMSKSMGATSVYHLREAGKSVADIYTLIGNAVGISEPVACWQQLADAVGTNLLSAK